MKLAAILFRMISHSLFYFNFFVVRSSKMCQEIWHVTGKLFPVELENVIASNLWNNDEKLLHF